MIRGADLAADAAGAAAAGFAAIGVEVESALAFGADAARRELDRVGLKVSSVMGLPDLLERPATSDARFATAFEVAAVIGAPAVVVGSGPQLDRPVASVDALVRERLAELGAAATARGVTVALEPMHPILRAWSYVHTLRHAARLVEGLAGVGLVVDVAHLWWDPDLTEDFARHVDAIVAVQIADVPRDELAARRYERSPLGTGDVPLGELLRAFHAAGYRGLYECEILIRMPREDRPGILRQTRAWLESQP